MPADQLHCLFHTINWMDQWNIWSPTILLLKYMSIMPSEGYNYTLIVETKMSISHKVTVTYAINPPTMSNRVYFKAGS